ncbi:hypothetical protein DBB29_24890 [Pandoraea cepalis]|uniref:Uncharacterized protein n=1 Tax=Pandoraea cepalis TaxID=2508294 RepID=A0AAW7MGK9_9BURK|nr:hypothetical protein [Pandoraea cepalis]MDN4581353.1 hypothetical protein [Pandoraea cepalis]
MRSGAEGEHRTGEDTAKRTLAGRRWRATVAIRARTKGIGGPADAYRSYRKRRAASAFTWPQARSVQVVERSNAERALGIDARRGETATRARCVARKPGPARRVTPERFVSWLRCSTHGTIPRSTKPANC